MRFDDPSTRDRSDRFAPIRELFDSFVFNCQSHYTPGKNICVDESMVPFRGRCIFRQYIPSKACKYGLKIWTLVDSTSHYMWNAQPYLGKVAGEPKAMKLAPLGERVVMDLTEGLHGAGRTITVDNFFTSYSLAQELYDRGSYLVGTIKKNKPEIPKNFVAEKTSEKHSKFIFSATTPHTLVKYQPKRNKSVFLLSTKHKEAKVEERERHHRQVVKPLIIHDYNAQKSGVDVLDFLRGRYSCSYRTKR